MGRPGTPARAFALNARGVIGGWGAAVFAAAMLAAMAMSACGADRPANPGELLLAPGDFPRGGVSLISLSEQESLDGPSAQVELAGPGFRALQSVVLFGSREQALAALDGIRADLVSRGEAGPGEPGASGIFEHRLGDADAASLFFIENRGLGRLTVAGTDRHRLLRELVAVARDKLADG